MEGQPVQEISVVPFKQTQISIIWPCCTRLNIYPKGPELAHHRDMGNGGKESQISSLSGKQEGSNEEVDIYKVQFMFKEAIISPLFYKLTKMLITK